MDMRVCLAAEAHVTTAARTNSPRAKEVRVIMVHFIHNVATRLRRDESGQGMAEYALLAALIAVAAIGAISLLGNQIGDVFNNVVSDLQNAS